MAAPDDASSSPESAAAQWMSRRDRGFTPAEQDEYLQWLSADPSHGAEIARLSRAWDRLDALRQWNPAHSAQPNADLLRPRRQRQRWHRFGRRFALAAAAALVVSSGLLWPHLFPEPAESANVIMHPGPRRLTLEDGSRVELNAEARIDVQFTSARRNVHLLAGEAHFIVAKNPERPFVVTVGDYTVRAVGTAFDVTLAPRGVAVLVTEGQVQLGATVATATAATLPHLVAGQQAVIDGPAVHVTDLSPAQIEAALAWQSFRLEFTAMPLRDVIAELNRYNSRQLVIEDPATAEMTIGADNVEAFVRLLDVGFEVHAEVRGDDLVLTRRP